MKPIFKKILIVLIVIIFAYILLRLFQRNNYILETQTHQQKEGFSGDASDASDIKSMILNDDGPGVTSVRSSQYSNLTLKDFFIKSSYNTAYTGSKMSMEAITYALKRGYRFIDFEVFLVDDLPVVGFSNDAKSNVIFSSNTLPLGQVFYNIVTSAFSAPTPNSNDPLFIHLRIKSKDTALYEMIAKSVNKNIKNRLYKGAVDGHTPISELMGKIVLIIDKKTAPTYKDIPNCSEFLETETKKECFNLGDYVYLESNGDNLRVYKYNEILDQSTNPPVINDNGTTDLTVLKLVHPNFQTDKSNPDASVFYKDYGIQLVAIRLYMVDANLKKYESLFNEYGSAIVPFQKMHLFSK